MGTKGTTRARSTARIARRYDVDALLPVGRSDRVSMIKSWFRLGSLPELLSCAWEHLILTDAESH